MSRILLTRHVRLSAVHLRRLRSLLHSNFRSGTLSDTRRVLTHLFANGNSGLHCTGSCYLQGSRTWCRTLSRDGRTGCRSGHTRRHVDPVLSLHNQKTGSTCCFGVLASTLSLKSSSPAWEEISEAEVDTGLDRIHASSRGKAVDQCCLPRGVDLALASIRDLRSFPHCLRVQFAQIPQGLSKSKEHSPAAIRHCGHEAWLSCIDMECSQTFTDVSHVSCKEK